jgi:tetratricopeptide (TPR) repeat protein
MSRPTTRPSHRRALAIAMFVCGCSRTAAPPPDLAARAAYFSGQDDRRAPRLRLLEDSVSHRLAEACLRSATRRDLERLGIADLEQRLDTLVGGHVVRRSGSGCEAGFPVFFGAKRRILRDLAAAGAGRVRPVVESLLPSLTALLGQRRDMVFHVLWSRVMDEAWDAAWRRAFPEDTLPLVVWVTYPEHPRAVGTNYSSVPGGGSLALTWSPRFTEHLAALDSLSLELRQLAWGRAVADSAAQARLADLGMLDTQGRSRVFAYPAKSPLDSALRRMAEAYGATAADALDWPDAARRLGYDARDVFVVLLHQVAYDVLAELEAGKRLEVPQAVPQGAPAADAARLTSLVLGRPPGPTDEALTAYARNGWHGSAEVVRLLREAVRRDARDPETRWYLGLSEFDVAAYRDAIVTFTALATLTADDAAHRLEYDWARLWIGQAHDALGERSQAIAVYRRVLATGDTAAAMQMGQYGIGPVTARDWARQRLASPFAPHR